MATFTEVESGKNNDRPQLAKALQRCKATRATLLVAKLDRLSRNAAFLFSLRESSAQFLALDIPEANTITLGVMIVLSQERELIAKRTREALARRKAAGKKMGNPRDLSAYQAKASALGSFALRAKAQERARQIAEDIDRCPQEGHTSLRAIAAYLTANGIETPRGKRWTPTAVRNALAQLKTVTETKAA